MRTRCLAFIVLGLSLSCTRLAAQSDVCLRRVVPVNVVTSRGLVLSDLNASNFEASVHHEPVKIVSVTQDVSPRRIIIVLDASGSMRGKWAYALRVVRTIMGLARGDDAVGIMTFSGEIKDRIPLTTDRGLLMAELDRLGGTPGALPQGMTALWDSSVSAIGEFDPPHAGDCVIVVGDGGDNTSKTSADKVSRFFLERGVRLFGLILQPAYGEPTPEDVRLTDPLPDTFGETGGFAFVFKGDSPSTDAIRLQPENEHVNARQAELALMMELHLIQVFERVEIELPQRLSRMEGWKLSVTGIKDTHPLVLYPHKLAACATP